ncbi:MULTISPECIES: ABC transporter ATP-binding protein [unclassified Methanoregula]|uniref:ATP-binding cassette domain-containing protein n=1 Tax=unclassified Methanoregula TaxID=2649730 RepID=UPI0009D0CD23|nr:MULTISPECIES: ABC transporter ATP-binding protein [unclassified Methanoregula]OPX61830.1 MAG: putative ABC transporter ATP-binding protein [Methanoregula sp. PtaB.Bin085]OPY35076.1 MAG: putative ABC transporter ATP-binding protein [Methanoregula sp. PtaU1.Bin006]
MIEGRGLTKYFDAGFLGDPSAAAVDSVDIHIGPGETLALVGESGCGKSTLGRMLLYLIHPTRGDVLFEGKNLAKMRGSELRALRWKFQIVSQHPDNALNPRWTVARSILEPFRIHSKRLNGRGMNGELERLIDLVGLEPEQAARYPHQLSGGELQRAVIARAIALDPAFIVCDEPTSMLDVSIQASIIRLLQERQKAIGCACLFITHDIQLARILGDRVAVMLGGRIVEEGEKILDHPLHPFTQRIVSPHGISQGNGLPEDCKIIPGACTYLPFCPRGTGRCHTLPEIQDYGDRRVSCHMVA